MNVRGPAYPQTLGEYVDVLRRRKWIILQVLVLVPVVAVLLSLQQEARYKASAEVLLLPQSLSSVLTGVENPTSSEDPNRLAETQAQLARAPDLADRVVRAVRPGLRRTPGELLASSAVYPKGNSDLLVFEVTDRDPSAAARLATAYARQFTDFRRTLDTEALRRARAEVDAEIRTLEASASAQSSPLLASLYESRTELIKLEALQTSNTLVTRPADGAEQVEPQPVRNGIVAGLIGLVVGIGMAFLWEALDRRIRSEDEVESVLGLPLLARVPTPSRRLRGSGGLAMLQEPTGRNAEAFRRLRTGIEFETLTGGVKRVMVSSVLPGEGKSTTVANLAVAFARAGKRVVVVDLDVRRPSLHRLFGLGTSRGLGDVALGRVSLDEAVVPIGIGGGADAHPAGSTNGSDRAAIALRVLPVGSPPPNAGEFVAGDRVVAILEELEKTADLVLVDAPPLLAVGDAMTLSARMDALVLVVRMADLRRPMLYEVGRLLERTPARKLGYVLTGVDNEQEYGYQSYDRVEPAVAAGER